MTQSGWWSVLLQSSLHLETGRCTPCTLRTLRTRAPSSPRCCLCCCCCCCCWRVWCWPWGSSCPWCPWCWRGWCSPWWSAWPPPASPPTAAAARPLQAWWTSSWLLDTAKLNNRLQARAFWAGAGDWWPASEGDLQRTGRGAGERLSGGGCGHAGGGRGRQYAAHRRIFCRHSLELLLSIYVNYGVYIYYIM